MPIDNTSVQHSIIVTQATPAHHLWPWAKHPSLSGLLSPYQLWAGVPHPGTALGIGAPTHQPTHSDLGLGPA